MATMVARLPNIIYILADDMGYGDPGCYNPASKIPTPHLDRLAREGVRCTDMHSPSAVCTPTRYGVLTGRYCWRSPLREGVLYNYEGPLIEPERLTVPALLRGHGYHTAGVGKWHLGLGWAEREGQRFSLFEHDLPWPSPPPPPAEEAKIDFTQPITGGPLELGFDSFFGVSGCATAQPPYGFIDGDRMPEIPSQRKGDIEPGGRDGLMVPGWKHKDADPTFTDRALRYLEERAAAPDTPFFLYLAASAPHEPCIESAVPEFARGRSQAGPRGDMVWLFDWMVGQVMAGLERLGLADDTLLMVTSDNGAMPGCLGRTYGHRSCGDWRGYKGYIWDGGHREPFLARWPRHIEPGSVCHQLGGLQDLMATAAAIVGAELPAGAAPDSANLLPALLGEAGGEPVRDQLIHHSSLGVFSMRTSSRAGNWKLIVECDNSGDLGRGVHGGRGTGPMPGSPGQLYQMGDDPGEVINLFRSHPQVVRELHEELERVRAASP